MNSFIRFFAFLRFLRCLLFEDRFRTSDESRFNCERPPFLNLLAILVSLAVDHLSCLDSSRDPRGGQKRVRAPKPLGFLAVAQPGVVYQRGPTMAVNACDARRS